MFTWKTKNKVERCTVETDMRRLVDESAQIDILTVDREKWRDLLRAARVWTGTGQVWTVKAVY